MTRFLGEQIVQATGVALLQFDRAVFPKFWALVGPALDCESTWAQDRSRTAEVEVRADRQALDDVVAALRRLIDSGREHTFHDMHLAYLVRAWSHLYEPVSEDVAFPCRP